MKITYVVSQDPALIILPLRKVSEKILSKYSVLIVSTQNYTNPQAFQKYFKIQK